MAAQGSRGMIATEDSSRTGLPFPPAMAFPQAKARLAGLLYLATIVMGLFAEVGARSSVSVRGDGSATAAAIMRNIAYYRAGEAADIVMLGCYIGVTALLYELFARSGRALSLTAMGFSLVGIAVLAANGLFHMAPLALLDGTGTPALPIAQRDALIRLSLDLHGDLYGVSLIFFGVYCILIGWLAIRSRALPPAVGALMIVGGSCHLLTRFATILAPELAHGLPGLMNVAPLIGETALSAWLLLFGVRTPNLSARRPWPAG
jgi:hypothetical protein